MHDKSGTKAGYSQLSKNSIEDNDLSDYDGESDADLHWQNNDERKKGGKQDHEIYKDTYYIPNTQLRLLEVPINSSLFF